MSVACADAPRLSDFEGTWSLSRAITSRGSPDICFAGLAVWSPEGENMRYREEGQLVMPGQHPIYAEREYIWTPDLQVYFADGRFFHTVLTDGSEADHWCDPDRYIGLYDFANWPVFRVVWTVSGPRKDYKSQTEFRRV